MPSQILLSEAQRLEFTSVPETITDDELEYFYSLRDEDIQIVNTHRGDENLLGFAMTICCLRHKGWPYSAMVSVAPKVISFVAGQIGAPATCISRYGENKSTRYNHLAEICTIYGYRQDGAWPGIEAFIFECARKMNDLMSIIKEAVRFAIVHKIIPQRITTLERIVRDTRAGTPTDNPVNEALNGWIKEELIVDFDIEGCNRRDEVLMLLARYQYYYNNKRPCFAIDYDTSHNFYQRFKRGEIQCKDTFKDRQLTDMPKYRRKQEKKSTQN